MAESPRSPGEPDGRSDGWRWRHVPRAGVARDGHSELEAVACHCGCVGAVRDAADRVKGELAHAHGHVEPKVSVLRQKGGRLARRGGSGFRGGCTVHQCRRESLEEECRERLAPAATRTRGGCRLLRVTRTNIRDPCGTRTRGRRRGGGAGRAGGRTGVGRG
eukprot:scaffold26277_cov114-Isochrysis_galbana.AAC.6